MNRFAAQNIRNFTWAKRPVARRGRTLRGFTLVELLVVIVIISMLTGLLLPALLSSRARARIVQCTNNQHELGVAMQQYDNAKQHLPGVLNQIRYRGATTVVSWVPVLFPFMGRNDLWEDPANGWRMGTYNGNVPPMLRIPQVVCPDDGSAALVDYPLTYAVNLGVDNVPPPAANAIGNVITTGGANSMGAQAAFGSGVFRNCYNGPGNAISLSRVRSASQTVMFGERVYTTGRQWTAPVSTVPADASTYFNTTVAWLSFSWPNCERATTVTTPTAAQLTILNAAMIAMTYDSGGNTYFPPLVSPHADIVVVSFCDGHVDSLPLETECRAYRATP